MYAEIMTADGLKNPWYWLLVTIVWIRCIQTTVGIPSDVMRNAKNDDPQAKTDALIFLISIYGILQMSLTILGPILLQQCPSY